MRQEGPEQISMRTSDGLEQVAQGGAVNHRRLPEAWVYVGPGG